MKKKLLITLYIVAMMLLQVWGQNPPNLVTNEGLWTSHPSPQISEDVSGNPIPFSSTAVLNDGVEQTSEDLSTDTMKTYSVDVNSVTLEAEISNYVVTQETELLHKTSVQNDDSDITTTVNLLLYNDRATALNNFSDTPPKMIETYRDDATSQKATPDSIKNIFTNMSSSSDSKGYEHGDENNASVNEDHKDAETESDVALDAELEMSKNESELSKLDAEQDIKNSATVELYQFENNVPKKELTENYDSYELIGNSSNFPRNTKQPSTSLNELLHALTLDHMASPNKELSFKETESGSFTILSEAQKTSSSVKYINEPDSLDEVITTTTTTTTGKTDATPFFEDIRFITDTKADEKYLQNETNTITGKMADDDVGIEFKDDLFSKIYIEELNSSRKNITIPDVKKTIGIIVVGTQNQTNGQTADLSNKTGSYKSSVKIWSLNPTAATTKIVFETESTLNAEILDPISKIVSTEENMDTIPLEVEPTRVPKKIQNDYERSHESRSRPARPDPGYHSYNQEYDYNRPYRPDSPSYERPYFRPTPDYRTPLIRQSPDYTRPSRPDQDTRRTSYRPEFGMAKPSVIDSDHGQQTSQESSPSRPYRPSFAKPFRPQSSFSKPYHPDYHKPAGSDSQMAFGKPEYFGSSKPDTYDTNLYQQNADDSERIRDDFEYTRQADANVDHTKSAPDSIRPISHTSGIKQSSRPIIMDSKKTSQTSQDSITEETEQKTSRPAIIDTRSRPTSDSYHKTPDVQSQTMDTTKPTKISNVGLPGGYPRPGFGSNYGEKPETTSTPFPPSSVMISMRNLTRVEIIKADCFDNHMKVSVRFNGSFEGLIYSSGYSYDPTCNYINGSGRHQYDFFIRLNRCGTLGQHEVPDPSEINFARRRQERAQYLVNTVSVQYNPMIEEDTDEHFRVTCEYGYDFWKTVTFPVINIESSAVKVREGSPMVFTLPPPQCNMEIRSGYGPTGNRISGPVNVGDPISLVIHMKSETPGFDILVSNCVAHNGAKKRLQLIDANGCVVQEKLISAFRGVSGPDRTQQLTLYSYLKAFRFTGSPALYIECDVHMCHGSCPPQRCYWRHLYKRSIENVTTPLPQKDESGILSESVSLFQALEVRHDEVDLPNPVSIWKTGLEEKKDAVCMRKPGFAAIFASLLILALVCSIMSIFLCSKIRRMKYMEAPPVHAFTELTCRSRR